MSIKKLLFGGERSLTDQNLFHKVSLIALFAWVGLGADGLSSSCYGPDETFRALGANTGLCLFVALAIMVTIAAICISYSQIIALFPSGGGGYLVASKLLGPRWGVVSGCALLVDYVLTVTVSVASGMDALFSMLPPDCQHWKIWLELGGVVGLTLINMRGVKESVLVWLPAFTVFVVSHAIAIGIAVITHGGQMGSVLHATSHEMHSVSAKVGFAGLFAILLRAYSMGAGTYTGIEAVSNGMPILREPKIRTGRRTMIYMGTSLALTATGLLVAYLLYHVQAEDGKTMNAVLLDAITRHWPDGTGRTFVIVTLLSEAALLIVAAQTGFLDGPRVLASMALDRWFPGQFANLSSRLVTQNGVLLMGLSGFLMMVFTRGSTDTLVILYSINVFITFTMSQLGMVLHWWQVRRTERAWLHRFLINGFGCSLTLFILVFLSLVKVREGGWVTWLVTMLLVLAAFGIKRHYRGVSAQLRRLDTIVEAAAMEAEAAGAHTAPAGEPAPKARTAIVLVNGYNGLGLHTVLHVPRVFGDTFRNYVFILVGAVDAGNFKGVDEIEALRRHTQEAADKYVEFARARGYGATALVAIGQDVMGEVMRLAKEASERFPNHVFFAGQLLFARETWLTRWLHNHTALALQRRFYLSNLPFVVLPIRVD